MAFELSHILASTLQNPAEFAAACDREFENRIEAAALQVLENKKYSPIVLLSGPSASGKTTTAKLLERALERHGVQTHPISLDDYYLSGGERTAPRTPEGTPDLESPLCLDLPLLSAHFQALSRGEEILVPHFDFPSEARDALVTPVKLGRDEISVFEGIHALHDAISGPHPAALGIFVSPQEPVTEAGETLLTGEDVRLVRRVVRDVRYRATPAARTLRLWPNVLRGEREYIRPFAHRARCRVNTSFACDLPALKQAALAALKSAGELPDWAAKCVPVLERVPELEARYLAKDSLLWEFLP